MNCGVGTSYVPLVIASEALQAESANEWFRNITSQQLESGVQQNADTTSIIRDYFQAGEEMKAVVLILGIMMSMGVNAGEVLAETFEKWDYRVNRGVRPNVGAPNVDPLPRSIWAAAGRHLVDIPVTREDARAMQANGSWGAFLLAHMMSPEDAFVCRFSDNTSSQVAEIEPVLTPGQESMRKTLPMQFLLPLPNALAPVTEGVAEIQTWRIDSDRRYARFTIGRQSVPRHQRAKGWMTERLFGYDRAVSADEAAFIIFSERREVDLKEFSGHKILHSNLAYDHQPGDANLEWFYWQSGPVIVCLEMSSELVREVGNLYLKRYPPTWDATITFDKQILALRILDRSLATMEANIEGPLDFLRYSYRVYPFDLALCDAFNVVLADESIALRKRHRDAIDSIHKSWASSAAAEIRLDDYQVAMREHRREMIVAITALRDRIRRHGFKRDGGGLTIYGDVTD